MEKVTEEWEIRGLVHKTGKKDEGERKKGEEGKEEDKKRFTYHEKDRVWKDVGERCKLVVDS